MRIESSNPLDSLSVPPPVREPGREEEIEADRKKAEEPAEKSDYMYALSVGSLINVQV
ncbi:hypothetical protein [Leptospira licerasiae]|uniref:Uncharacterized protein n=1 Tax=Leptospira licerasiae str. MMD4847 TaxID=1049971 RepID=A0ABN0H8L2_9LEPT|nr:hypothetical protein [Leptospira licerasiae]EIE00236.1 hypothetical protein LEP1GSC185_2725 [Leptospira licerasiae serovar Varillal str. VAR 010]EJZ42121.1 hypothetical protein LEP1GSC178_0499 [Leptospira licerasiae str. MMD4847]